MFNIIDAASVVQGKLINVTDSLPIHSLSISSGEVTKGALFIAIKGTTKDGHAFISESFERGAVAAVVEDENALGIHSGILVPDSRLAAALLSDAFFNAPSKNMITVGVTGTNGKTTTNWIIYHFLNSLYGSALRIGTLGSEIATPDGKVIYEEGNLTSPDAISIGMLFSKAASLKVKGAVIEASSIALHQSRLSGLSFDAAIFTNLTRDHLDYHKTMEEYFKTKLRLFKLLSESKKATRVAVVNVNDEYGKKIVGELQNHSGIKIVTFGSRGDSTIRIGAVTQSFSGSRAVLTIEGKTIELTLPLIGHHNVENACAVLGVFLGLGHQPATLIKLFEEIPQVPGRLESVGFGGVGIFVNYAHTPDALENVLQALRPVTQGKLWALFGCGGNRNRGKRPQMANIAGRLADYVVVTSDNPRTEDPNKIIFDILESGIKPHIVEADRRRAISQVLSQAAPGDVVLIAGKGHEDYQIIGTTKYHFSDVEEVRKLETKAQIHP